MRYVQNIKGLLSSISKAVTKSTAPESDVWILLSVQDNLVKGAAGQAVQNMNIMLGLPETAGLQSVAVLP